MNDDRRVLDERDSLISTSLPGHLKQHVVSHTPDDKPESSDASAMTEADWDKFEADVMEMRGKAQEPGLGSTSSSSPLGTQGMAASDLMRMFETEVDLVPVPGDPHSVTIRWSKAENDSGQGHPTHNSTFTEADWDKFEADIEEAFGQVP